MASKRSKVPLALVFIFSLAAVGALLAAAATPHWVTGIAVRQNLTDNERPQVPDENGQIPPFTGYIQFGLFNGEKIFNFGFTQRAPVYFSIFEEHAEVYSIGFPIAAFVSVLIAAIFGLVSTIFGLVNTITVPIETIHGPVGLYVWNGIGAVCSLVAWVLYLALLLTKLTTNILNKTDMDPPNNFRTDSVSFAYSYWLVVVACALFILNLIGVFLAKLLSDPDFLQQRRGEKEFSKGENNVGMDEMMY